MSDSPAIQELKRLRRMGFHGEPILDEDGNEEVVYFVREFRRVREVVLVYSEHDAYGYRTRFDESTEGFHPLIFNADAVEMIPRGDVVTVVHKLLSLPPASAAVRPRTPDARPWTPRPGP